MTAKKIDGKRYPFTRMGLDDDDIEDLARCLQMGMGEGEEYPVCHLVLQVLHKSAPDIVDECGLVIV